MRVGQNPAKSIDHVPQPQPVTVAIVTYIPFLGGYYSESLQVLKACLGSLWASTPEPHDVMIFDNASDPAVRAYLAEQQQQGRIQYLTLADKNIGKGGAWNFIFQAAPGEFIAYADSDIEFRPGWLGQSLDILRAFPQAGMVTARPLRTPEAYYTSTLTWARAQADVAFDEGRFTPWEVYREHVLSLGVGEDEALKWYNSRLDIRLSRAGVSAQVSAAHFQFTAPKTALLRFTPFEMTRPMGQVRSLDEQMNEAGYLRLCTPRPLVRHMGNRPPQEGAAASPAPRRARLVDRPPVKKALLRLYDWIFDLYHS
ncbi:MAG: glycosyltransferase family 2 protein [Chloroflexi bacterium]|nr:glycosyltransferase family 2 protein [Chloroflexota bacterium]